MTKKMLIDAAHPEEVRVALLDNGKVEDFDFESAARKPLRGNIYLARVTRVEPSLQAAFVEYGGNRHGFLAFSEIHPDYYQIPVSDRQALQAAEAEVAELAAELELSQRGDEDEDDHHHDDHDDGPDDDGDDEVRDAKRARFDGDEGDAEEDESDQREVKPRRKRRRRAAKAVEAAEEDASEDEASDESDNSNRAGDDDPTDEIAEMSSEEEEEEEEDGEDDGDVEDAPAIKARREEKPKDAPIKSDADGADDPAETGVADGDEQEDQGPAQAAAIHAASETKDLDESAQADQAGSEEPESRAKGDDDEESVEESADDAGDKSDNEKRGKSPAARRQELFERYKEAKRKRSQLLRNYKIQEVIKRRQILLIQVVKEERGNKGAALTTYMSLAGRYCVLMPNTARGGGISRKIPHSTDRRRLRRVVDSLDVPQGMGLIIRTAGAKRTKTEIKRDYDYLLRLWENIRTLTLKSIAPCLIYEEASLIKRAIRDLYDKDISEVLVEGEAGYREAKDFMKMLMPSHAKHVQPYKERAPIFLKNGVETQLDGMYQPTVRLKSGGYIVIHQTEALVAIDVNSGRATRERNIEQTALKTNIEAAYEAARQFRLRDLAGLIVLDFIDMEEPKNNRKVEKALKDAIKHDRARIQLGRISNFGLLEMSRQRRRSGIVDGTTQACPTCTGAGVIRSAEMAALRILRAIEGEAVAGKAGILTVHTSIDVAVYILNQHRDWLKRIEDEQGVSVEIVPDREKAGDDFSLEKSGVPRERVSTATVIQADQTEFVEVEDPAEAADDNDADDQGEQTGERKKRRRRRRRKDASSRDARAEETSDSEDDADEGAVEANEKQASDSSRDGDSDEDGARKRRRRGRRGGRRNRRGRGEQAEVSEGAPNEQHDSAQIADGEQPASETPASGDMIAEEPQAAGQESQGENRADAEDAEQMSPEPAPATKANGASHGEQKTTEQPAASDPEAVTGETEEAESELAPPAKPKPKKRGWWNRGA